MTREERFGIGNRIDALLLDLLETLRRAGYLTATAKINALQHALGITDSIRFFLQIAWESKLIKTKHYENLAIGIEEIGRMTNGWRKGVVSKTPPEKGGERNG